MTQVSRPMQIALAAVLVFAVAYFAVLKPKDPASDVAAAPVTPAQTTPAADPGATAASSALGKTVESAKSAGKAADAAVKRRDEQTGEETPTATPEATPGATTPAAGAPAATTPAGTTPTDDDKAKRADRDAGQARADRVVRAVAKDLKARRAVVVLVWAKSGEEDRIMHRRVTKQIDRRRGDVKVYAVPVSQVAKYDGLLGGLALGQIPSTVVIAPDNQAKVLGGLASTDRIDRLTSSATLTRPVATTP